MENSLSHGCALRPWTACAHNFFPHSKPLRTCKNALNIVWSRDILYPYQFGKSGFTREDMKVEKCIKESFVVIGKEGSTLDGEGFIQRLWIDANSHFEEVQHLAKKDESGNTVGIWGAMSDFSRSFQPWEDFRKGLYLAGVECRDDAEAPSGWIKWIIPGYEYIYVECEDGGAFSTAIKYLEDNSIPLAGAVHDFTCPQTGKNYMFFSIRKL